MRLFPHYAAALLFAVTGATVAWADDAPSVPVRAAAHDSFDRIVIDWPRAVPFHMTAVGGHVTLRFDAPGQFSLTPIAQADLTRLRHVAARHTDNRSEISFTTDPAAKIHPFTSGPSIVFDISGKPAPAVLPDAPPAASVNAPPTADPTPAVTATPLAAITSATTVPQPAKKTFADSKPATPPPTAKSPPPGTTGLIIDKTPVLVAALDPHIATRAAIFKRAGSGYIIFDRKLTLTAAALTEGKKPLVDLQPLDLPKNSGFSFAVPGDGDLHASLQGTVWNLYVAKSAGEPPITTTLVAQPDFALGARFILPAPDAPEAISFTDPIVGDTLILVPLAQSEAFAVARRMADFDILPAAQGLVIRPRGDKLIVRPVSDGVEVTAEGGLLLSNAADTGANQQSGSKAKAAEAGKSIFDFATWRGRSSDTFTATRQRLQQTIVDVPEVERNRARLELARFYFASGDGAEALSMLNTLAKQVPDLRAHGDFLALLGASDILANRPEQGLAELDSPLLAGQQEIELWQAIALSELRDWPAAEDKFVRTESTLAGYPEPFFSRYMVLAVEAAEAAGKDREAADWLATLNNGPHADTAEPAIAYLTGVLQAKAGHAAAAAEAWKKAQASTDQLYKVRAELALIDLGVANRSLTPAQAADRLEALRFGWRGDDLEIDILHRLGLFYIQAKNIKTGLGTLAQAMALYPNSPLTPQIHAEMQGIFHDIFLGNLGKTVSPLDSLTFYHQYRDLMPAGPDGDAVMRNLSERLVAIDLLDQAADIFNDLITNHLQGADKDRAALRLAGIYLLDHKPQQALTTLDAVHAGDDAASADIASQQILLRARALSELNREAEANALLNGNATNDAKVLRADIAMRAHDWPLAAQNLMALVGPPPATGHSLSPQQAQSLIGAATAYALSVDQGSLDRLAIDYGAAMATTPQADTFRMLTEAEKTGQLRDLAAAQAQIARVDMFQGFLNTYRAPAQPAASPLSTP